MDLNHRFLVVGQESLPLDHGTVIKWTHWELHPDLKRAELVSSCWTMSPFAGGSRGTRTHKSHARPTVFKTGSSSGRMTSVRSCGSWNRTNIKTFRASRPTVRRSRNMLFSSGGRNRTYDSWFKVRQHYHQRRPRNGLHFKSALRELNPPRQLGRLAPLPLGQGHTKRKERESNPQGSSLDCFRDSCHRQLACPSVIELRRQESNLRRVRVNSRLPVPARAPPQSSRRSWI